MNKQLKNRVDEFNDDYFRARGKRPGHFFCPITLRDEPGDLIKGHVFSQSLSGCSKKWVPQRKDVDNVFSAVEADFHAAIHARNASIEEILADKKLFMQIRPTFEFKDSPVKAMFHRTGREKREKADFIAHLPAEEVGDNSSVVIDSIIDRDDSAAAFICALQSAHLTMFELLGYWYVFSYPGKFLAGLLGAYVKDAASDKASRIRLAQKFHAAYMQMVIPLEGLPESPLFEGTLHDQKLLSVVDQNHSQYAMGVVTRFVDECLVVLLPMEKSKSDIYLRSLMEPITSIEFQVTQLETFNRRIVRVIPTPELMTIQVR